MRKLLILITTVVLSGTFTSCSTDPQKIVERFTKQTNINALKNEGGQLLDMTLEIDAAGQKMTIPFRAIVKKPENMMNVEMAMMGNTMTIIYNGKDGWIRTLGQVQSADKSILDQYANQMEITKNFQLSADNYNMEFIAEKDGKQIVRLIPKNSTEGINSITAVFDKTTGMLLSTLTEIDGGEIKTTFSEYKKFGQITMPSIIEATVNGQKVKTIINQFDTNYTVTEDMFAEPKPQDNDNNIL